MTKTQLRKRWKNSAFLASIGIPTDRAPSEQELQNLDLRGVPKLSNGDPLWHFRVGKSALNLDFSYGDGVFSIYDGKVTSTKFVEFKFDRASYFRNSVFVSCDFERSQLRMLVDGCIFENCSFELSAFVGGPFCEYGIRRSIFRKCTFRSSRWDKTYIRACQFVDCDLTRWQIIDSIVAGFKHQQCVGFDVSIFIGGDVRPPIELPSLQP